MIGTEFRKTEQLWKTFCTEGQSLPAFPYTMKTEAWLMAHLPFELLGDSASVAPILPCCDLPLLQAVFAPNGDFLLKEESDVIFVLFFVF